MWFVNNALWNLKILVTNELPLAHIDKGMYYKEGNYEEANIFSFSYIIDHWWEQNTQCNIEETGWMTDTC